MWDMRNRQNPIALAETLVERAKRRLLKSVPVGSDSHWVLPGLEEFDEWWRKKGYLTMSGVRLIKLWYEFLHKKGQENKLP